MGQKRIYLFGGVEEGSHYHIMQGIGKHGKIGSSYFDTFSAFKVLLRSTDKAWVTHNIPSSIWWFNEIHHDWKDGGRMYLLSRKEHQKRDKNG